MTELYCMPDGKSIVPFKIAKDIELHKWKLAYELSLFPKEVVLLVSPKAFDGEFKRTSLAREIEKDRILVKTFEALCYGVSIPSKVQHLALHGKGRTKKKNQARIKKIIKTAKKRAMILQYKEA